jgi:hypothetical protein
MSTQASQAKIWQKKKTKNKLGQWPKFSLRQTCLNGGQTKMQRQAKFSYKDEYDTWDLSICHYFFYIKM